MIFTDPETDAGMWDDVFVPPPGTIIEPDAYDSPDVGDHPTEPGIHIEGFEAAANAHILRSAPRTLVPPRFKRELRYKRVKPMNGRDVFAVERTLKMHGFRHRDPVFNYGWRARNNVKLFQDVHRLSVDGVYGPKTHSRLAVLFDGYAKWLYSHTVLPKPPSVDPVDKLMRGVWTLYALRPWLYHAIRPFRLYSWGTPISYPYDCSWFVTEIFYGAGLPDPNGISYQGGSGNTESLRGHGHSIGASAVGQPGDLVFFGYYGSRTDPAHVAMCVDNGMCIGFGSTGGPRLLSQRYRTVRDIRRYV